LAPDTAIEVASVLMPSGAGLLEGMPRLLRRLGIGRWIVTPLLKAGRGPVSGKQSLYRSFSQLQDAADDAGVRLIFDDELDCLEHKNACATEPALGRFDVRTIPSGIELIRLEPGGEIAIGRDILLPLGKATPRWHPAEENAGDFLRRLTSSAQKEHVSGTRDGIRRAA
jgi:hypothetical protein